MPEVGHYVVTVRQTIKDTAPKELLETLKKQLANDPEAEVKSAQGERIVIRATDHAIRRLRSQYGDRLIIEPDTELEPFTA